MIPAAKKTSADTTYKYHQLRVAAYCRVSTEQEEQQNSYQVQIDYYTDLKKATYYRYLGILTVCLYRMPKRVNSMRTM